jgi:hypothetical protein
MFSNDEIQKRNVSLSEKKIFITLNHQLQHWKIHWSKTDQNSEQKSMLCKTRPENNLLL